MAATYRNESAYLPAHRATVWVGAVCVWPGQTVTVASPLSEDHPAIVRGGLRRIDGPAEPIADEGGALGRSGNAESRSDLWRRVKALDGGAAAYVAATGQRFRESSAVDLAAYLNRVQ